MSDAEAPQFYLITPPEFSDAAFPDQLARLLDGVEIACVRLAMASQDETRLSRAADLLRAVCHERDVAMVITDHVGLVERLGLDGVHLSDGARAVRSVRKTLGADAIVGAFCGASRHDGINAAEAGADYVAFGPVTATALGHATPADRDLFAWWSEMIEVPVVAEGALNADAVSSLSPITDFLAPGDDIWASDDPLATLKSYAALSQSSLQKTG